MFASSLWTRTASASTRIDRCHELAQIVILTQKLRIKVDKLKLSADQLGAASVDYRKYRVLSALLGEIDAQVAMFNRPHTPITEPEILMLVQGLSNSIARIRAAYNPILAWPRDQNREIADVTLSAGVYAATLAAAAALPLATIGTLIAFFYSAPWLCSKARETTGLNNHLTESIRLLDEWQTALQKIKSNLEFRVPVAERLHQHGSNICPEQYICIVNQEMMDEPYICILDGITYERDVILRCLTERRKSPYNNAELPADKRPEDVLILNRNLKDLIDEFKAQHPDFKYAEDVDEDDEHVPAAAAARM